MGRAAHPRPAGASVKRALLVLLVALAAAPAAHAADGPLTISTSVAPRPVFFGDRVRARAEIVVRRPADADTVRFAPGFTPFAVTATHKSRTSAGGVTTLGFVYELLCLNDGCL